MIPLSIWLSYIQGFYACGTGYYDKEQGEWVKFDGLSGNQVVLFQALDAFLGIDQYLAPMNQERNVPRRQREFCHTLRKHSFRKALNSVSDNEDTVKVECSFAEILKRLQVSSTTIWKMESLSTDETL
jgi:hypothetical protein